MDGTRFDALARQLAQTPSRRRVVQSLGGGLAAGLLAVIGMGTAEAAACKSPNGKCGKGKNATCTDLQTDNNNCGTCGNACGIHAYCASGMCQPKTATLGCAADSTCQSPCPQSGTSYCSCGTTIGGNLTCYQAINGCLGTTCSSDSDCGTGNVCVNMNGGLCGGCDNYTGGTLGICNPICSS